MRKSLGLIVLVLAAAAMLCTCIHDDAYVREDDIETVNAYICKAGLNEITLQNIEDCEYFGIYMYHATSQKQTGWDMIVAYVRNAQSSTPKEMDYTVKLGSDSVEIRTDKDAWELIGH